MLGARRREKLESVAGPLAAEAVVLDVANAESVDRFVRACPPEIDLLVNNAGGALGVDRMEEADDDRWLSMWESNVMGVARMTRGLLPALRSAPHGHIVVVTSVSAFETYVGGGGYTAAKHGARALTKTLRLELLGEPIRVTEICPGLTETEFATTRFYGDTRRAAEVYRGMTPLTGEDVAECVRWAATQPPHVNIDEIVVRPRDQATATLVHRRDAP